MATKKLIEVALPLDKINEASAREKSIRHGHPSTLHLWWARRPLAATRAVLWASMIDDPSAHPELFPTDKEQNTERQRLFKILEDMVVWENTNSDYIMNSARNEIRKNIKGEYPVFLDPFAGGGAIPLEAQRLGLIAHAHDLNPIAVMINKSMLEIPHRFYKTMPVNPEANLINRATGYTEASGIAEDVRYYGAYFREIVFEKVKNHYPKIKVPVEQGGGKATVIAWIWARTAKCNNPACGHEIPLCSTYILSKKRGRIAWIQPELVNNHLEFRVKTGDSLPKDVDLEPKKGRGALFKCPVCGQITEDEYIKEQAQKRKMGQRLLAVIGDGTSGRVFVEPDDEQKQAAIVPSIDEGPIGEMSRNPRWFSPPEFGMTEFSNLFTNRQMLSLTTFCKSLGDVKKQIVSDASKYAPELNKEYAEEYAIAIITYLSFLIDQMTNHSSTLCGWNNINNQMKNVFSRQALPMVWDFAECNMFSSSSGSYNIVSIPLLNEKVGLKKLMHIII